MNRLAVAPIVEGDGEVAAVPVLLRRIWHELLDGEFIHVVHPIHRMRGRLLKADSGDLEKAIKLAVLKLQQINEPGLILILIDAEDDCRAYGSLGPLLLQRAKAIRGDADICCVIANTMFETWFAASAESFTGRLNLDPADQSHLKPEIHRCGKAWLKRHLAEGRYSETADQSSFTAAIDLQRCRQRSKSFDKLCREIEQRRKTS